MKKNYVPERSENEANINQGQEHFIKFVICPIIISCNYCLLCFLCIIIYTVQVYPISLINVLSQCHNGRKDECRIYNVKKAIIFLIIIKILLILEEIQKSIKKENRNILILSHRNNNCKYLGVLILVFHQSIEIHFL